MVRLLLPFASLALFSGFSALFGQDTSNSQPAEVHGLCVTGSSFRPVPLTASGTPERAAVAVLESAVWSPNDPVRDGAREFEIFLTVAGLVQESPLVGLVSVGNRAGLMRPESERALRRVALMGVPVVKAAAKQGHAEVDNENFFIEAGALSASECREVLADCLARFGTLSPVADPSAPSEAEIARLKAQVAQYQLRFAAADSSRTVAAR